MSVAATTAAQAPPAPEVTPSWAEPRVRGESLYDRVTSALYASVGGAALVFGWLSLIWITQQAYASREAAPLEIVEVVGGEAGGDGSMGGSEAVDMGADTADQASNAEPDAPEFEEPVVMETPDMTIDEVAADSADAMEEMDFDVPTMGSKVATGKRASKLGKGSGFGSGTGTGDGGVRREDRWSVIYPAGQTIDEYARQLDFLRVELGTTAGNILQIASNFSTSSNKRVVPSSSESRLFFMWQGGSRKGNDVELLRKAGINVGEAPVFQFYPKDVEDKLAQLEVRYKGRQPIEIRSTKFAVVPAGGGKFGFKVLSQEALR